MMPLIKRGMTGWMAHSDRYPLATQASTEAEALSQLEALEQLCDLLQERRRPQPNWIVKLLDADCDRCGKRSPELRPWQRTDTLTYRGRTISEPWLCRNCFRRVKLQMDVGGRASAGGGSYHDRPPAPAARAAGSVTPGGKELAC